MNAYPLTQTSWVERGTAAMDAASHVSIGLFGVVPINSDVPSAYLNSNKSLLKGDA